jgi:MFS family permease
MSLQQRLLNKQPLNWANKTPFFYGWVIVFIGSFSMFFTTPGQSDSFSFFMDSFVETFGWSRTFVSSLYSASTLLSGCLMFYVGRLVDRFGSKKIAVLAAVILGVACMMLSFVMSPFMLFAGFFLARLAGKGALDLSASTLAPQWFIKRRALSIMLVGLGGTAGAVVFPLLNTYLINTYGWREAFRILAGGLWLIYVPITLIFLINRPEDAGLLPDNSHIQKKTTSSSPDKTEEPSFTQAQAIRTSAFWILAFCLFQSSLVGTGVVLHFVSIFKEQGFSMTFAATIMGMKPLVGLVTTVLLGLVLDKIGRHHLILAGACILQMFGYMLLAFLNSPQIAFIHAIIYGISGGIIVICLGVLKPNLFGRRYLGGILGVAIAVDVIGSAIGPIIFGAAFDWLHSYKEIILISALLPFLAGVLCLFIRKPTLKSPLP